MNAYYRLYIQSVIKLAATLVIKSSYDANAINTKLIALGTAVDLNDPFSWKYYLNLSGQYHAVDTMMRVVSLDTGEMIDFTIANLNIHRATKKDYVYGTRNYINLVAAYPTQPMLINGIVNPIPIDTAFSADDHNILSYDSSLVEPSEQQLIPELQSYIDSVFVRWDNPDYNLFEPFYYPTFIGTLTTKLVLEILNSRKAACKTDQAHSYHIQQYLLSFSSVGLEFDYLSQKQKLFFYRNMKYLNRNGGRQETFDLLTQKVMTDRGFSLAKYTLGHTYANITKTLDPEIVLDRVTINGINPAQGNDRKTVAEMLDLEVNCARDNFLLRDDTLADTTRVMEYSLFNQLPTKVLESNVVDRTDAEPFTLTEVLLNHWIYLSHYNYYNSVITFTNPANGDEYRLSVKNAFIFYLYAYNRSVNIELMHVPVIGANRVRRIPLPERSELRSMCEVKKVPDYYIDYILDTQVPISPYISTEAFRAACTDIHQVMLNHRDMRHYNGDYVAEGQLHSVIDRCYMDIRIDLAEGQTYNLWIAEQGIDISSMGNLEFDTIASAIFTTATGGDLGNTTRLRDVHASMIRIMTELNSYSVQFIAQINDSPVKIIDGKFPKLTVPKEQYDSVVGIETPAPEILSIEAYTHSTLPISIPTVLLDMHIRQQQTTQYVPVAIDIKLVGSGSLAKAIEMPMPMPRLLPPTVVDISTIEWSGTTGYGAIPAVDLFELITGSSLDGYELLTPIRRAALLRL